MKPIYYMAEVAASLNWREATPLRAQTLQGAKREATRKQIFCNTELKIATTSGLDDNGFIYYAITEKPANSRKWIEVASQA